MDLHLLVVDSTSKLGEKSIFPALSLIDELWPRSQRQGRKLFQSFPFRTITTQTPAYPAMLKPASVGLFISRVISTPPSVREVSRRG